MQLGYDPTHNIAYLRLQERTPQVATIRSPRLLTVTSSLSRWELGRLSPDLQARVSDAVRRLFALEPNEVGVRRGARCH